MSKTALAVRTAADLPAELSAIINGGSLPAEVIIQAVNTTFAEPLAGGFYGDIARALVRAAALRVNALLGHVQLIPQTKGYGDERRIVAYSVFTTLPGRIAIAHQQKDENGKSLLAEVTWGAAEIRDGISDYPDKKTREPVVEKRVYVSCRIRRTDGLTVEKWGACQLKQHGEEIASARAARNALKYAFPEVFSDLDDEADVEDVINGHVLDVEIINEPASPSGPAAAGVAKDAARAEPNVGSPGETHPSAGTPASTTDQSGKATAKQIRALAAIASHLGWTPEQRRANANVASFKNLTFDQASSLIEEWKQLAAEQAAAVADEATRAHDALAHDLLEQLARTQYPVEANYQAWIKAEGKAWGFPPDTWRTSAPVAWVDAQVEAFTVEADRRAAANIVDAFPGVETVEDPAERDRLISDVAEYAKAAYPDAKERADWLKEDARLNGFPAAQWREEASLEWMRGACVYLRDFAGAATPAEDVVI